MRTKMSTTATDLDCVVGGVRPIGWGKVTEMVIACAHALPHGIKAWHPELLVEEEVVAAADLPVRPAVLQCIRRWEALHRLRRR